MNRGYCWVWTEPEEGNSVRRGKTLWVFEIWHPSFLQHVCLWDIVLEWHASYQVTAWQWDSINTSTAFCKVHMFSIVFFGLVLCSASHQHCMTLITFRSEVYCPDMLLEFLTQLRIHWSLGNSKTSIPPGSEAGSHHYTPSITSQCGPAFVFSKYVSMYIFKYIFVYIYI